MIDKKYMHALHERWIKCIDINIFFLVFSKSMSNKILGISLSMCYKNLKENNISIEENRFRNKIK